MKSSGFKINNRVITVKTTISTKGMRTFKERYGKVGDPGVTLPNVIL